MPVVAARVTFPVEFGILSCQHMLSSNSFLPIMMFKTQRSQLILHTAIPKFVIFFKTDYMQFRKEVLPKSTCPANNITLLTPSHWAMLLQQNSHIMTHWIFSQNTLHCCYNIVNFLPNPYNRHPIAHTHGTFISTSS